MMRSSVAHRPARRDGDVRRIATAGARGTLCRRSVARGAGGPPSRRPKKGEDLGEESIADYIARTGPTQSHLAPGGRRERPPPPDAEVDVLVLFTDDDACPIPGCEGEATVSADLWNVHTATTHGGRVVVTVAADGGIARQRQPAELPRGSLACAVDVLEATPLSGAETRIRYVGAARWRVTATAPPPHGKDAASAILGRAAPLPDRWLYFQRLDRIASTSDAMADAADAAEAIADLAASIAGRLSAASDADACKALERARAWASETPAGSRERAARWAFAGLVRVDGAVDAVATERARRDAMVTTDLGDRLEATCAYLRRIDDVLRCRNSLASS